MFSKARTRINLVSFQKTALHWGHKQEGRSSSAGRNAQRTLETKQTLRRNAASHAPSRIVTVRISSRNRCAIGVRRYLTKACSSLRFKKDGLTNVSLKLTNSSPLIHTVLSSCLDNLSRLLTPVAGEVSYLAYGKREILSEGYHCRR
jgi:hypothetical protein